MIDDKDKQWIRCSGLTVCSHKEGTCTASPEYQAQFASQPTQSNALAPHLGTVCYKTSDGKRSCDRTYNMTDDILSPRTADTINRQAAIDAVADWRILDGTGFAGYAVYNCAIDDAVAVIKAMPNVTVTEDMVERACMALSGYPSRVSIRAALVAALGE